MRVGKTRDFLVQLGCTGRPPMRVGKTRGLACAEQRIAVRGANGHDRAVATLARWLQRHDELEVTARPIGTCPRCGNVRNRGSGFRRDGLDGVMRWLRRRGGRKAPTTLVRTSIPDVQIQRIGTFLIHATFDLSRSEDRCPTRTVVLSSSRGRPSDQCGIRQRHDHDEVSGLFAPHLAENDRRLRA